MTNIITSNNLILNTDQNKISIEVDEIWTGHCNSYPPVRRDFKEASFKRLGVVEHSRLEITTIYAGGYGFMTVEPINQEIIYAAPSATLKATLKNDEDSPIQFPVARTQKSIILVNQTGFWYSPWALIDTQYTVPEIYNYKPFICELLSFQYCGEMAILTYKRFIEK